MSRLERVTHKLFAENAPIVESGTTQVEIGQFGSALAGTYVATNDVETLQALPAYSRGWGGAVIPNGNFPTLEDMNAVQRVQSYQTGYLYQEGIPEYDANTTYYEGSVCKIYQDGSTSIATSLINENTGNPLTDTASWAISPLITGNVLRYNRITNCITEIPQRIKLELNNGTLTLKAGSKVIVPNGDGVFDEVTIASDKTNTQGTNGKYLVFAADSGSSIFVRDIDRVESGTTRTLNLTYSAWYDITNNLVMNYGSSSTTSIGTASFPLALITVSNGAISSIDQVFNGMGYIGSTVWVDKGVKGLIPNGRNEDGTLSNIEITTQKVVTRNFSDITNAVQILAISTNGGISRTSVNSFSYDDINNFNYSGGNIWTTCVIGEMNVTNSQITSFQPKLPFRAADNQDVVKKTGDTMTGRLNIDTSGNDAAIRLINSDVTQGNNPSAQKYTSVVFADKDSKDLGAVYYSALTSDERYIALRCGNKAGNGTQYLVLGYDSSNRAKFTFPKCTTKPTTTSSARNDLVAVVVQNYLNGTSWYRVYSDGFCVQGGTTAAFTGTSTISLLKNYSNTNYVVVANSAGGGTGAMFISNKATSSFNLRNSTGNSQTSDWVAYGYTN